MPLLYKFALKNLNCQFRLKFGTSPIERAELNGDVHFLNFLYRKYY